MTGQFLSKERSYYEVLIMINSLVECEIVIVPEENCFKSHYSHVSQCKQGFTTLLHSTNWGHLYQRDAISKSKAPVKKYAQKASVAAHSWSLVLKFRTCMLTYV